MGKRDRTGEILEIKGRGAKHYALISTNLEQLRANWQRASGTPDCKPDFYVIRAVTILEVFTRNRLAALVNHSKQYAARASLLMKDNKIDFDTLQSIQGRVITLGDIVGHSVPVN